ncbi:hypothetical protein [Streptomyces sp. NPDC054874]
MRTRTAITAAALAALVALGTTGVAASDAVAYESRVSSTNDDPPSPDVNERKIASYSSMYACVREGDWGVKNGKWKKYKCHTYPHWEYVELWVED